MGENMELKVKNDAFLLEYLEKNLDISRKKIKEYLKFGSIYVDNVKTTQYDYPLIKGSIIFINTKSKSKPNLPFSIIYEDKEIIVVDKPSNILTISNGKERDETVYHLVSDYLKRSNKYAKLFVVHRLDKDTSGVLLFAKNEYIKNFYQKDWNKYVKRKYIAIVHNRPRKNSERLVNYLKETKTNLVYIARDGREAITNYNVVLSTANYSKLEIEIETGRKNQIRVQLANIGSFIVGDKKYGKNDKEKRLYLHTNSLTVYNKNEKKYFTYYADVPESFTRLLNSDLGRDRKC